MSDADKPVFDLTAGGVRYCQEPELRARISILEARVKELEAERDRFAGLVKDAQAGRLPWRDERGNDRGRPFAEAAVYESQAANLEARIAELARERDRMEALLRWRVDSDCLRCQARADECCAYCGNVPATKLAAARAERDEATDKYDQAMAALDAMSESHSNVAAERDEAVGLLGLCQRHWGAPSIAAGDDVGPVARERAQTRERIRALLARLAAAPETPKRDV